MDQGGAHRDGRSRKQKTLRSGGYATQGSRRTGSVGLILDARGRLRPLTKAYRGDGSTGRSLKGLMALSGIGAAYLTWPVIMNTEAQGITPAAHSAWEYP